jgi:hypothetical protein
MFDLDNVCKNYKESIGWSVGFKCGSGLSKKVGTVLGGSRVLFNKQKMGLILGRMPG